MKNYLEEVDKVIESALIEKTFNLDIIGKIKELRDELLRLQESNEILKKDIDEKNNLITGLNNRNNSLSDECEKFKTREKLLNESEKELYKKEQTALNESSKLTLVVDLFKIVFRNTEVRSEMFKNDPIIVNGYSQGSASGSETKTEHKE